MGNNVAGNLVSRLKLWRRITRSAGKWEVKEGAPTTPEEAAEWMQNVEAVQSAASTGELSGVTAAGGATPEVVASISVAYIYIAVAAATALIIGAGLYLAYQLSRPMATPGDGPQAEKELELSEEIKVDLTAAQAEEAEEERELSQAVRTTQDIIIDPSNVDPEAVLRTAQTLLKPLSAQTTSTKTPQDNKPEFSVNRSDQTPNGSLTRDPQQWYRLGAWFVTVVSEYDCPSVRTAGWVTSRNEVVLWQRGGQYVAACTPTCHLLTDDPTNQQVKATKIGPTTYAFTTVSDNPTGVVTIKVSLGSDFGFENSPIVPGCTKETDTWNGKWLGY